MLYHPQQSQELAARIQEALNLDATQREALSQAARETVVALTWEKHMAEWAGLLG
jgi:glycosyltransferase involved in cell wall biosynthesis